MSHLSNLLEETERFITCIIHKSTDQIKYIGSANGLYCCTWDHFLTIADKNYTRGGGEDTVVATDLIIVFKDNTVMYRSMDNHYLECWDVIQVIDRLLNAKRATNVMLGHMGVS